MTSRSSSCRDWHARLMAIGFNSLPSDGRRPAMHRFVKERDEGYPKSRLSRWTAEALQVCTGSAWGLAALDLDGEVAVSAWADMARFRDDPPTWKVVNRDRDGSLRGVHLYYALPEGTTACPSRLLFGVWDAEGGKDQKGDWVKRTQVEFKGDRGLMVIPPSLHWKTGLPYRWSVGPDEMDRPAMLPAWIAELPTVRSPRPCSMEFFVCRPRPEGRPRGSPGGLPGWQDVLDAVADKMAVAQSWGLRMASARPNASGWVPCHAAGREDRNPSASFRPENGRYWEHSYGQSTISLFELGVLIGAYPRWVDCLADLWERFGPRRARIA